MYQLLLFLFVITGRLSFFTSGAENPHYVEKLKRGIRYAITVSFTCDASKAISDPNIKEH